MTLDACGVARLKLNRPKAGNSLNQDMWDELRQVPPSPGQCHPPGTYALCADVSPTEASLTTLRFSTASRRRLLICSAATMVSAWCAMAGVHRAPLDGQASAHEHRGSIL